MIEYVKCPLCGGPANNFHETPTTKHYRCQNCFGVFLEEKLLPTIEEERARYELHNNDMNDPGYLDFVQPIIDAISESFSPPASGLDFGCGPNPVVAKLLRKKRFDVDLYDPFFHDEPAALKKKYDFIVCNEVMEHFHHPAKEFKLLRKLLKPKGALFCMTDVLSDDVDFAKWYYKNDKTHVFFYHMRTLEYIKKEYGYSHLNIKGRVIGFIV
jgi:SAM-dependent methyltransferase